MVGQLKQTADGLALVLSPEIVSALKIDTETRFDITTSGDSIIATPVPDAVRRAKFQEALRRTNEQYGDALRRLAK